MGLKLILCLKSTFGVQTLAPVLIDILNKAVQSSPSITLVIKLELPYAQFIANVMLIVIRFQLTLRSFP